MAPPKGWKNLYRRHQNSMPDLLKFAQSLPYSNQATIVFFNNVAFGGGNIDYAFGGLALAAEAGYPESLAFATAKAFAESDKPSKPKPMTGEQIKKGVENLIKLGGKCGN